MMVDRTKYRSASIAALLLIAACTTPGSVIEEGTASVYADSLAGNKTANGETYDPDANTCAHRKIAFGTVLQVERVTNGKKATCRVTDRGPYHDDRIIDLSRSVGEQLDIDGIAKVRLRKISEPKK